MMNINYPTPAIEQGDYIYASGKFLVYRYLYRIRKITEEYAILTRLGRQRKWTNDRTWDEPVLIGANTTHHMILIDLQWFRCRKILVLDPVKVFGMISNDTIHRLVNEISTDNSYNQQLISHETTNKAR